MSPGIMTLEGRTETTEGIDKKLAVHYYARVTEGEDDGEQAAVMSVMAAGAGGAIDVDDLAMKNGYSLFRAGLVAPTYNDLMMESFAAQEPRIPFIHNIPGAVRTSLLSHSPSWMLRVTSSVLMTLTRPFTVTGEECAQYLWHGIYSTAVTPGAWRIGSDGEDIKKKRYFGDDFQRTKLWEHTAQVMKEALASK
ncbi:hypothetical protein BJ912DRAFT_962575 [Pholiota molesta]|nr:hypothetical protein BJ912DRAFT_962575 [Pholiota molesta]